MSIREALGYALEIDDLAGAAQRVAELAATLELLERASHQYNVLDLLDLVVEHTGYQRYIRDGSPEGEERWTNIQELGSVARDFAALPPREGLAEFLSNVALVADVDTLTEERDRVTLITLHAAKGLEFAAVFLAGMEENIFPHSRSIEDPAQMEEERRLAYVGITRAKKFLYLLSAHHRTLYGRTARQPSFPLPGRDPRGTCSGAT